MKHIWKDGILGVVVGDALGCPVQFDSREQIESDPVKGMRGYGTFNLPAGSWTDDSSLTLATMISIRERRAVDCADILDRFVRWLDEGEFTPYGYSYDIGKGTRNAINAYKKNKQPHRCGGTQESNNGNGSLMRILPVCLFCLWEDLEAGEAVKAVHEAGSLTHAHICSNIACGLYYFMARSILTGAGTLNERLRRGLSDGFEFYDGFLSDHEFLERYARLRDADAFAALPRSAIRSSGYVVHSLEAAVWVLMTSGSFSETLLKAVNLGEDTDSVAAIAGGLAGLYYGADAIPSDWISALQRREWIEEQLALTEAAFAPSAAD